MGTKEENLKRLTPRERDVLEHIFKYPNLDARGIGEIMIMSFGTIQTHKTNINKKLRVPSDSLGEKSREWLIDNYFDLYEQMFYPDLWLARQEANRLNEQAEMITPPSEAEIPEEPVMFDPPPEPIMRSEVEAQSPSEPAQTQAKAEASDGWGVLPIIIIIALMVLLAGAVVGIALMWIDGNNMLNDLWEAQSVAATSQAIAATSQAQFGELQNEITQDQLDKENLDYLVKLGISDYTDPNAITGDILLEDSFDAGSFSYSWLSYGDPPAFDRGMVFPDWNGFLGLKTGEEANDWRNYAVYADLVVGGCYKDNTQSKISVRKNGPNFIPVYLKAACGINEGTIFKVLIIVQGELYSVLENGQVVNTGHIYQMGHNEGGIVLEIQPGSALDYIRVTGLP